MKRGERAASAGTVVATMVGVGIAFALAAATATTTPAHAQGTSADYERAAKLQALTSGKVFRHRVEPRWSAGSKRLWYRVDLPAGAREWVLVEPQQGERCAAFDHAKLAEALGKAAGRPLDARRLPLDEVLFADEGPVVRLKALGRFWSFDASTFELKEGEPFEAPRTAPDRPRGRGPRQDSPSRDRSPDGRYRAFIRDHNVFLRETDGGRELPLSTDGTADDPYAGPFYWSPDSSRLVVLRTRKGDQRKVYYVESSPPDQVQPKLHSYDYLKPGDRIPQTRPRLFDVASKRQVPVSEDLFANPWSVSHHRWDADSKRFTFLYNQRGHTVMRLLAIDAATGAVSPVIDEPIRTFFDYNSKLFLHRVETTSELIWMSERDGWCHLYLVDARTGAVKNQITKGPWVVRGVDRVDEEKRQVWFRAGGVRPGQDPYYVHHCRANFDGTGLVILTEGDGTHDVRFSPDGRHLVDTWSRVDHPPVAELRRSDDGRLACTLERGDWSELLATGWKPPQRFVAKGRDGVTDIFGVIWRPTNHDPAKRYPVVEHIYAGPHGAFVPKSFSAYHGARALAELGFIVVQIDGMGTNYRSKAFHDVAWKNLGDSGFPDRILWIKAAAAADPSMDLTRVGIYGGSAGGQSSTRALLAHGDFYKVAVSDCGCHDNRVDKIWWNELWMSWPVGEHYAEASNVTHAHKLTGKLLLIVGEADRNVDPASTMQVVNALVKADKDFDLLVIPGAGHGAAETPYGRRRRADFFVRHLLGVEPRRPG